MCRLREWICRRPQCLHWQGAWYEYRARARISSRLQVNKAFGWQKSPCRHWQFLFFYSFGGKFAAREFTSAELFTRTARASQGRSRQQHDKWNAFDKEKVYFFGKEIWSSLCGRIKSLFISLVHSLMLITAWTLKLTFGSIMMSIMPLGYFSMENWEIPIICKFWIIQIYLFEKEKSFKFLFAENNYFKCVIIMTITRGSFIFFKMVCKDHAVFIELNQF